jgi:hypothetical protein
MLQRSTKIWLAIYAVYTLAYLSFVRSPGPPLVPGHTRTLVVPTGVQLLELRVLPDERRALAGVSVDGKGELWVLDWARVDQWLTGQTSLLDLVHTRMAAPAMPHAVWSIDGDTLGLLFAEPEREWVEWGGELVRHPLPPDTAWVNEHGRTITFGELDAQLAEQHLRAWPALAGVANGFAYTRINAASSASDKDQLAPDDFLIFDASSGQLITHVDTYTLAWTTTVSRLPGVLYATNDARWLEAQICDESGCATTYAQPRVGSDRAGITGVDVAPESARAALCVDQRELMFFSWEPDQSDGTVLLGQADIACELPTIVDKRRVLVRDSEKTWTAIDFAERGGWL